ncbi:hypothetical protein TrRE_jg9885 [Triparma retinervis]|uniref:Bromo domain-containing protein n=1 Tax=Triparma retinervis TaxID=2557542 RepID=A0A9W7CCH0_9STRA|nr:hypothetical protein TrRE_jg9885 [Triparma retinervis]
MDVDTPQPTAMDQIISFYTSANPYNPLKGKKQGGKQQPEPTFHCLLPGDLRVNPDPNYNYVSGDLRGYHDSWASSSVLGQSLGPLLPRTTPPESLVLRPRMSKTLKTQEMDKRLFAGRDDHLTPRQKYDIYMENVALTLQRQVVVKKKEDEEEKFIDQIYSLQFGAAKINPFRQELGDDFFKLYPEYREKCPLPMDLVKMKDKNEGLLYGVDLKSILTDCQLMVDNAMNWNTKGDTVYSAAEQLGTIDIPRLVREICVPKLKEVKKKFKKLKKEKLKKEKEEKEAAAKEEAAKELKALDAAS